MQFMKRLLPVVVVALVAVAGCSSSGSKSGTANAVAPGGTAYTFAVITHGSAGDAFWTVVKNGALAAGRTYGVKVTYQSDGDPQRQAQLIDAAVNQKVDGLVVSMANPDALRASIQKAVKAKIPVITINSGENLSTAFGALAHVGQDETVAGQGAGTQLRKAGVTKLICVIHEAGNVGLEQRCNGARQAMAGVGKVQNFQVDVNNVAAAQATIQAKLQSDKAVDGVLTLNPAIAEAAVQAAQSTGSRAKIVTFDVDPDVIKAINAGSILFAVDQQQYLQGYLPIEMLYLYKTNLNVVGGGKPVLTGPGFVTRSNALSVAKLARAGRR